MAKKKSTSQAEAYIHGYSTKEQQRLYHQARFLEQSIYKNIDLSHATHTLEVGCGVGAQTEILLRRYPHLKITGVDGSATQLKTARKHLAEQIKEGRVNLTEADALDLPFSSNSFDSAFLCWFLEHVQDPVGILREVHRALKPGSVVYCNEVLNSTFFVHPYSPHTLKYWFEFNDYQWSMKGDPFVGAKLANLLLKAGYREISTKVVSQHLDNRYPKQRADFIEFWIELLLSGAPSLIAAGRVTQAEVDGMKRELHALTRDPDSVFFFSWVQARALVL